MGLVTLNLEKSFSGVIMTEINPNELRFEISDTEIELTESELTKLIFEIDEEQYQKYLQWRQKIEEQIIRKELETGHRLFDGEKLSLKEMQRMQESLIQEKPKVYYGVIENGYIFSFQPNQLGIVVTVRNTLTGDELNLTNFDNW
jgi:hypothetical protein